MIASLPTKFFDMLPLPIVVVENTDTPNQKLVYLNQSFLDTIGWELDEIPDKEHWWKIAYPDPHYRNVVERQWQMSIEPKSLQQDNFVILTVNIMTKHKGEKRFKVYTEISSGLLEGYVVVAFEEVVEQKN